MINPLRPFQRMSLFSRVLAGVLGILALGGLLVALTSFETGRQAARQSYDRLILGAAIDIADAIQQEAENNGVDVRPIVAPQKIFYPCNSALLVAPKTNSWQTVMVSKAVLGAKSGRLDKSLAAESGIVPHYEGPPGRRRQGRWRQSGAGTL